MVKAKDTGIAFHYMEPVSLKRRTELRKFIARLLKKEHKEVDHINYIFCSDEEILRVNKQYLNHNFYTDIITFELSPKGAPLLADIYISVDRVRENARGYNIPFCLELYRVIFHGALHLCGYKDKSKVDIEIMRKKEEEYLEGYVPRGMRKGMRG